jgi:hypothetical protein
MRKIDRGKSDLSRRSRCCPRKKTGNRIYAKKADGDFEAHLIALSCSRARQMVSPGGLKSIADKVVELNYIDSISHETVRRVLKNEISLGKQKDG